MIVAIGSKNPTKIDAVRLAFSSVWPDQDPKVVPVPVASGVRDQPMSDEEAFEGAQQRATAVLASSDADYGVGLEGGVALIAGRWFDSGWCVIRSRSGSMGVGTTLRLAVPPPIVDLLHAGHELGSACDIVFGTTGSKTQGGFFGAMTAGQLDRTKAYKDSVVSALSAFIQPNLWTGTRN